MTSFYSNKDKDAEYLIWTADGEFIQKYMKYIAFE